MFPPDNMKKTFVLISKLAVAAVLLGGLGLANSPALAQIQAGAPGQMNGAMLKLFGDHTAFSAKAQVHVLDRSQKETTTMPMTFELSDRKVRVDVVLTEIKSVQYPASVLDSLKQMGMSRTISIVRPDMRKTLSIYPDLKAYAEIAMSKEEAMGADENFKAQQTALGKETVDGHACEKNKVILTGDKGEKQEATTWNATDLKGFPIRIRMSADADLTVIMDFKDVKLARPDAARFEGPAGMTKYSSNEELMRSAMAKMTGGPGGPK